MAAVLRGDLESLLDVVDRKRHSVHTDLVRLGGLCFDRLWVDVLEEFETTVSIWRLEHGDLGVVAVETDGGVGPLSADDVTADDGQPEVDEEAIVASRSRTAISMFSSLMGIPCSCDATVGAMFVSMERIARLVLKHRLVVAVTWLVLLVAGGAAAGPASGRLSFDFSLPGQPGYQTEQKLIAAFGTSTADTLVPVLTMPAGSTVQQHAAEVAKVWQAVRTALPQLRVVDGASTGDQRFITDNARDKSDNSIAQYGCAKFSSR